MFNLRIEELRHRWSGVQTLMSSASAEAMLISNNVNLYYLSGGVFSGLCYLPAEGDPIFFVRRPVGLTGENVHYIRKAEDMTSYFSEHNIAMPTTLMMECDSTPVSEYRRYEAIFTGATITNATPLLRKARSIKSEYELGLLRRSGELHTQLYEKIPALYCAGMSDLSLSAVIEYESRKLGSLGIFRIFGQSMEIFMGSVLAGDNADNPSPYDFAMGGAGLNKSLPVGANGTTIEQGMSVMVDLGGNFTGYMTDMTRVFSRGELSALAHQAHACSIEIQRRICEVAREGVEAKRLYQIALECATEAALADYFMGHNQKAGFVGHGIGIEINESPVLAPRSRDVLEAGMVFALEPKFVIPGVGAVGIENSFVVHSDRIEKITNAPEHILALGE